MSTAFDRGRAMPASPPHHAWAWFARQRLLWRATLARLAATDGPLGARYRLVSDRDDVIAHLKADYPVDDTVRTVVHDQIDETIFLGHAHRGLAGLGIRNAPRGLRWWWAAVAGAEVPEVPAPSAAVRRRQMQLDLLAAQDQAADVNTGWGDA